MKDKNDMPYFKQLQDAVEYLNWLYERLVNIHGENKSVDYMMQFKRIIAHLTPPADEEREKALRDLNDISDAFELEEGAFQGWTEEVKRIRQALQCQSGHDQEWFYRWVARAKAGYAGMSFEQCIDMIWHSPDNPYKDENPWEDNPQPPKEK